MKTLEPVLIRAELAGFSFLINLSWVNPLTEIDSFGCYFRKNVVRILNQLEMKVKLKEAVSFKCKQGCW